MATRPLYRTIPQLPRADRADVPDFTGQRTTHPGIIEKQWKDSRGTFVEVALFKWVPCEEESNPVTCVSKLELDDAGNPVRSRRLTCELIKDIRDGEYAFVPMRTSDVSLRSHIATLKRERNWPRYTHYPDKWGEDLREMRSRSSCD